MSGAKIFTVKARSDFLAKQASAPPVMALAECVWNSLDADATRVDVEFQSGPLGLERIIVRDNGTGMTYDEAPGLFEGLGGSWKTFAARTKVAGRFLHGREGRGRFKAFALGRVADWRVTFQSGNELKSFQVSIIGDDLGRGSVSEPAAANGPLTGVELTISEPLRDFRSLSGDDGRQGLTEVLAPYLLLYPDVRVSVDGVLLDAAAGVAFRKPYALSPVQDGSAIYPVTLEVIEWKRAGERCLYLCGENGLPLLTLADRLPIADRGYCAYLKSPLIQVLHDRNELGLGDLSGPMRELVAEARQAIRDHLRQRAAAEAQDVVQVWKNEDVYPYREPPSNPVEVAKREVFDIVAVTAARHIEDFDRTSQTARRLQLRTLRTAVERGDEEIQFVLSEVIKLPKREVTQLASLLRETSLSAIIGGARVVADRLKVIEGLEALVFEEKHSRVLKERTQLHRLVAENTWLFGDEFHLMVDDEGLTRCLAEHARARNIEVLGSAAVLHPNKKRGIVDLMFGRQRRPHGLAELEHLVVELKAPKVVIKQKEVGQVEGYAQAVIRDSRFDKANTRWVFCVLSKTIDEEYCTKVRQIEGEEIGTVARTGNLKIVVRTWASVFSENRARLKFFQDSLALRVTREAALDHLRKSYSRYLEGVLEPPVEAEEASVDGSSQDVATAQEEPSQ
ncbi:ATP-binding protein [Bradyrhizobium sp. USDA 4353]